jgi:hypothetical protein
MTRINWKYDKSDGERPWKLRYGTTVWDEFTEYEARQLEGKKIPKCPKLRSLKSPNKR